MGSHLDRNSATDPLMVPTREVWEQMSPVEQDHKESSIIAALEQEFNLMGETTVHFDSRASATEVLRRFFKGKGKTAFIASDLHTLYPGERAFYPDLLVVFDVEPHHRRSWNVMREGKGLDFALEILSKETKRRDRVEKLNLYARLAIPEYFIFDPELLTLHGYQLFQKSYTAIESSQGKVFSEILGLYLKVEEDKLRFSVPDGLEIPFANELMHQLNEKLTRKDRVIADYARELAEEKQRTLEEKQKAKSARQKAKEERQKAKEERQKAKEERQKVKEERQKAKEERQKAKEEKQRALAEKERADKAEAELQRLRQLLDLKK
ncbi:MAG: Uma2 family endonuclease [SAR324 cluster bacterium]|nr:Uma2 family endonuclease [SAR324 cluster bacterium]